MSLASNYLATMRRHSSLLKLVLKILSWRREAPIRSGDRSSRLAHAGQFVTAISSAKNLNLRSVKFPVYFVVFIFGCIPLSLSSCNMLERGIRGINNAVSDLKQSPRQDSTAESPRSGSKPTGQLKESARLGETLCRNIQAHTSAQLSEIAYIFPVDGGESQASCVLLVDRGGQVALYNQRKGGGRRLFKINGKIDSVAYAKSEERLAVAGDREIDIRSAVDGSILYSNAALKVHMNSLAFSPDGRALLMGGADARVYRWKFAAEAEAESEKEREKALERYIGHSAVVGAVAYHPFGRVFFSADWRGRLNAWLNYDADIFQGEYDKNKVDGRFFSEQANRMRAEREKIESVDFLRLRDDGEFLFLASQSGIVELWQIRGFKKRAEVQAHKGLIYNLAVSPTGDVVATCGRDGMVRIWKVSYDLDSEHPLQVTSDDKRYGFTIASEQQVEGARALHFLDATTLLVGTQSGRLQQLSTGVDLTAKDAKSETSH